MNTPFYVLMRVLPKNCFSQVFGVFTRLKIPFISAKARDWFARYYQLNMDEAELPLQDYPNIASLFIRHLKEGARPIAKANVVSPVDGKLSQTGCFEENSTEMIQAKSKNYTLASLIRDEKLAKSFEGGAWATIYLAPFNYHRIHSPVTGSLVSAHYIPGTLWPVNKGSVNRIEGLFAINERIVSRIAMENGAEILVVKVGATNVGRIVLSYKEDWISNSTSLARSSSRLDWEPSEAISFEKGQEIARFEMGSTVILVANKALRSQNPELFKDYLDKDLLLGQSLCPLVL